MYKTLCTALLGMLMLISAGCEDAVLDVEPPVSSVEDSKLDSETQIPFLVTGLHAKFAQTYGALSVFAGGLSDELVFDRTVPGATYPTYAEIESGMITLSNTSVEGDALLVLAELRLLADTLVTRTERIQFADPANKTYALYYAYFYGAVSRYFWGAYFGLEPELGGGVINAGPFIPSAEMYAQALDLLTLAQQNAPSAYEAKVAASLAARIHLIEGRYAEAAAAAANGLADGDPTYDALYNTDQANFWNYTAGSARTQFVVDDRYPAYVAEDPGESARVPIVQVTATRYRQDKYPLIDSPLPFVVWQEMALIQAEAALRDGQTETALDFINSVRQSHGLDDLDSINLDGLFVERDKELFCMGIRLLDERRSGNWHLPAGTWHYLPITQRERDSNPNIH